jgi:N-acetylmuramic acid 6-phosphate etherase
VLDAVECPPTFGVSPDVVVGMIAGGDSAFVRAAEGAEDSETLCAEEMAGIDLASHDLAIGLAASGRTPYVLGGLGYARRVGCRTVALSCNRDSEIGKVADLAIEPVTGPEVLTGSTRLKAGTAQKMILNMISTGAMVGIGKVYQNLMVDVQQTNEKLVSRALNITMDACGCSREEASSALSSADGDVKCAIVMILAGVDVREARARLELASGHIRRAIG